MFTFKLSLYCKNAHVVEKNAFFEKMRKISKKQKHHVSTNRLESCQKNFGGHMSKIEKSAVCGAGLGIHVRNYVGNP